jgi:Ca2+-transporting ATPase
MERKPRPLSQPVLSRAQWVRIIFVGLLMAIGTLALEAYYASAGAEVVATMALVVFSLFNIVIGLSARDETGSVFNRDILSDRNQLRLYGLAILMTFLPTVLDFLNRFLGVTALNLTQWTICIALAIVLLLIIEVVKVFMRRGQSRSEPQPVTAVAPQDQPVTA